RASQPGAGPQRWMPWSKGGCGSMSVQEIIWIATLGALLAGGIDWLLRLWFEHRAKSRGQTPDLAVTINDLNQRLLKSAEEKQQLTEERDTIRRQLEQSAKTLSVWREDKIELEKQRREALAETAVLQQRLRRAEEQAKGLEEQLEERVERHQKDAEARG